MAGVPPQTEARRQSSVHHCVGLPICADTAPTPARAEHHHPLVAVTPWLGGQVPITTVFQRLDGHALHVLEATTRPEGEYLGVCQALGITLNRGASRS